MSDLCLTLLCPRGTEEKVMDVLLASPGTTLFTSATCSIHGLPSHDLDATEQVLGGARSIRVQALLTQTERPAVLELLRGHFRGAGLRYWVTPVLESGEIA